MAISTRQQQQLPASLPFPPSFVFIRSRDLDVRRKLSRRILRRRQIPDGQAAAACDRAVLRGRKRRGVSDLDGAQDEVRHPASGAPACGGRHGGGHEGGARCWGRQWSEDDPQLRRFSSHWVRFCCWFFYFNRFVLQVARKMSTFLFYMILRGNLKFSEKQLLWSCFVSLHL